MAILEICVDSPEGLQAAIAGGADRIELCSALAMGGLTPSAGLMALAARAPRPVLAMIRPRGGGFDWSEEEIIAMEAEIDAARHFGLAGVVIGATRSDQLDAPVLTRLCARAHGLDQTLHRCIDLLSNPLPAVDLAADLGIARILTSGGALKAVDGLPRLQAMQTHAAGRITIMPGAGVSLETLPALQAGINLSEVHASASVPLPGEARLCRFGFHPAEARQTDQATVAALKAQLG